MQQKDSSDSMDQRILKKIMQSPKINKTRGAVRTAITYVRNKNKGLTLNAAASIFAEHHGINVSRYLQPKDRASLVQSPEHIIPSRQNSVRTKKIKKNLNHSYGKRFWQEAYRNAEIYPYLYVLENSLRNLILETFKDEEDWWSDKKFVSVPIQEYAKKIQEAEKNHPWLGKGRGAHPIYYVNLEHLFKIIEKNFNPRFKKIFDLQDLSTWIKECVPIRNLVAHNIRTEKEERENIKIRAKYICNLIEK